jgi:tripeptide aminopeptidase
VGLKGSHPPRTLVFFVQEEVGLVGARGLDTSLLGEPLPDMCFNFDGSDMNEVVNKVTGTERLNISITGIPAHTQNPTKGISAIVIAAEALAQLQKEGWNGAVQQPEGKGSANLGIIRGGKGSNVVMPELYALAEARSFELEFLKTIIKKWKDTFKAAVEAANKRAAGIKGKASIEFSPGPFYAPYFLPEDAPVIQTTLSAMKKVGLEPRIVDDAGGQDSSHVVAKGIPTAGLSFGGFSAHAVTEYVDIPQFLKGCALARELAIG